MRMNSLWAKDDRVAGGLRRGGKIATGGMARSGGGLQGQIRTPGKTLLCPSLNLNRVTEKPSVKNPCFYGLCCCCKRNSTRNARNPGRAANDSTETNRGTTPPAREIF